MMDREYSIMKYTTTEWVVAADDNGASQIIAHCPSEGIALTIRGMYLRHDKLVGALEEIAKSEPIVCPRCEGNGRLWADGKPHYPSEQRDTILCGDCGGSGYLQPENAQEIAEAALKEKP